MAAATESGRAGLWQRMVGRDRHEPHRTATPLELLFDLCFVVAVAQLAAQLHHGLAEGLFGPTILGYGLVFFAIWWAWMNFTWFASAYDTDDVPYRVLTLLQIAGVLVLAAGIPAAVTADDWSMVVVAYVMMRSVMIVQWLRAAHDQPLGRGCALRFAIGIGACQVAWVVRLALPSQLSLLTFALLVVAELLVPVWAERAGPPTPWHPHHIAERYGLFTLIVLGECVLAATTSIQGAITAGGLSPAMLLTAAGGLLLIFGMWWAYFKSAAIEGLESSLWAAFVWGYGHYFVFAAVAALGAGLQVVIDTIEHTAHVSDLAAGLCVALPVAIYLVMMAVLHGRVARAHRVSVLPVLVTAGLVVAAAFTPLGVNVLLMGVLVCLLVAVLVARTSPAVAAMSYARD